MEVLKSREELIRESEQAAEAYLGRLHIEHFMEASAQATQRKITLESLDLVQARRPEVQVFNKLLIQYSRSGRRRLGQLVPDNMVAVHHEPLSADSSFDLQVQPARPFWVLEYVSKYAKHKDYEDHIDRYETELRVPYFLLFYPDTQDLTLYRHTGERYVSVLPNEQGRHAIPELELELALLDGWVRYWFRGQLLPLPAQLQAELDQLRAQLQVKDEQLQAKDEQLQAKDEQLQAKDEQIGQMLRLLRDQVEVQARVQSRQDILDQPADTTEVARLSRWIAELRTP